MNIQKLLLVLPIILLVATECNGNQNTSLNSKPPIVRHINSTPTSTSTPAPPTSEDNLESAGGLMPTQGGQLYTNRDFRIQITVPLEWTLGKTSNANIATFIDKDAATTYYEQNKSSFQVLSLERFVALPVLTIHRFPTLDSYRQFMRFRECGTLKQCWADSDNSPEQLRIFTTINSQLMYVTLGCGDICEQQYLIQYKGAVYRFDTASGFYTNDGSIEKTLKFIQ
jgi:hypothetical protein